MSNNKNKSDRFLFSAITNENDIILPSFKSQTNLDFVKYGEDNNYPNELLELFNKSSIHSSIIESKVRMMIGDGIIQTPDEVESDKTQMFIDKVNPFESMDDIYRKISLDFEIYGAGYIEVLWNKKKNGIVQMYHIDATKIRWGKLNNKGRIDTFYYSNDWSNYRKSQYKPEPVPVFDDMNIQSRQIIPIVRYTPGLDYYSYPDYVSGIKWINIDGEIANFHYNNIKNGMAPGYMFSFPVGETTNEERKIIEEKINEKYTGTNQASKNLITFYDSENDNKPEVTVMDMNNADKQYDLLNTTTLQQILIAHKVTNENLVGISTPGKLGSSNEMLESYNIYFNTVIQPEQQYILSFFKRVMLINGMNDIEILNNKPFEFTFSENILKEILTQDELREIIGYDVLKEEEDVAEPTEEIEQSSVEFAGVRMINKDNALTAIPKANLNDIYMWQIKGDPENNCPGCREKNGLSRSLKEWMKIGIPGVQDGTNFGIATFSSPHGVGSYANYCKSDCKCSLKKIGTGK